MKKPFMKLSTALRLLFVVTLVLVALLILEADAGDQDKAALADLVLHAFVYLVVIIAVYLVVEFVGVARGYIHDDVGTPPEGGSGLPTIVSRLRFAKRAR